VLLEKEGAIMETTESCRKECGLAVRFLLLACGDLVQLQAVSSACE